MNDNRTKLLDEKRHVTSKISDLIRYIGFGLVAVTYALFTSSSQFAKDLLESQNTLMLTSSLMGALTILFDYLQFLSGYIAVNSALKRTAPPNKYSTTWLSYKGRQFFFVIKQLSVGVGLTLFCIAIVMKIFNL